MKPITHKLGAGILPAKMINDGRLSTFARLLFPILTLFAVPDETLEEWEFDIEGCNKNWMPVGKDKIIEVLKELSLHSYIEDLGYPGKNIAVFSFPDWVNQKLRYGSDDEAAKPAAEAPPGPPASPAQPDSSTVHKNAPPAGFVHRVSRKGNYKCTKCKRKIGKGEKYWHRGGGMGDRICETCAGGEATNLPVPEKEENKIPFGEAREVMKEAQEKFITSPEMIEIRENGKPRSNWPVKRDKTIISLVGADLSLDIIRALHDGDHVKGDAFQVIDLTRGIIEGYLEAMPEL